MLAEGCHRAKPWRQRKVWIQVEVVDERGSKARFEGAPNVDFGKVARIDCTFWWNTQPLAGTVKDRRIRLSYPFLGRIDDQIENHIETQASHQTVQLSLGVGDDAHGNARFAHTLDCRDQPIWNTPPEIEFVVVAAQHGASLSSVCSLCDAGSAKPATHEGAPSILVRPPAFERRSVVLVGGSLTAAQQLSVGCQAMSPQQLGDELVIEEYHRISRIEQQRLQHSAPSLMSVGGV